MFFLLGNRSKSPNWCITMFPPKWLLAIQANRQFSWIFSMGWGWLGWIGLGCSWVPGIWIYMDLWVEFNRQVLGQPVARKWALPRTRVFTSADTQNFIHAMVVRFFKIKVYTSAPVVSHKNIPCHLVMSDVTRSCKSCWRCKQRLRLSPC